jgi:hypothetical protein
LIAASCCGTQATFVGADLHGSLSQSVGDALIANLCGYWLKSRQLWHI